MPLSADDAADYHIDFDALNMPLLAKVRDAIAANGEHFSMRFVISRDQSLPPTDWRYVHPDEMRTCGTVACIAGWTLLLASDGRTPMDALSDDYPLNGIAYWQRTFAALTGLPCSETTVPLCFVEDWPVWFPHPSSQWSTPMIVSLSEHDGALLLLDLLLDRVNPWQVDAAFVLGWRARRRALVESGV